MVGVGPAVQGCPAATTAVHFVAMQKNPTSQSLLITHVAAAIPVGTLQVFELHLDPAALQSASAAQVSPVIMDAAGVGPGVGRAVHPIPPAVRVFFVAVYPAAVKGLTIALQ